MNILIINHSVQNCGVYQYGKRFGHALAKAKNHKFIYLELNSQSELESHIQQHAPEVIIYNHVPGTMLWVTPETVQSIRVRGIKQLLIVHNLGYLNCFDGYLHQDPYFTPVDSTNFSLPRPLPDYEPKPLVSDGILRIGSFGFGFRIKLFEKTCQIVNQQITDRPVEINLHITSSFFCAGGLDIDNIKQDCRRAITNENIKLNFTHEFISDESLLDFLSRNDLNVFLYHNYPQYNGIASTIDYGLAVRRPLAICKSNMFSHISGVKPSICVEDLPLMDIIKNGCVPLQDRYEAWSHDKLIEHVSNIVEVIK